jgi:hypothetical protein
MDMVGIILRVVILHEESRALNSVIVALTTV